MKSINGECLKMVVNHIEEFPEKFGVGKRLSSGQTRIGVDKSRQGRVSMRVFSFLGQTRTRDAGLRELTRVHWIVFYTSNKITR